MLKKVAIQQMDWWQVTKIGKCLVYCFQMAAMKIKLRTCFLYAVLYNKLVGIRKIGQTESWTDMRYWGADP